MDCWEVLGIEPTGDRQLIAAAYERQSKFAQGDEAERLRRAYREALGGGEGTREEGLQPDDTAAPGPADPVVAADNAPEAQADNRRDRELTTEEQQVVHDVKIQVKALLNDPPRYRDTAIWKAILAEPPADEPPLRRRIGRELEPQLVPMAENGSFPAPVVRFLGDWFDWYSLHDAADQEELAEPELTYVEDREGDEEPLKPQMVNFWPAVIGWIVGLVILASLFGGMGSGS